MAASVCSLDKNLSQSEPKIIPKIPQKTPIVIAVKILKVRIKSIDISIASDYVYVLILSLVYGFALWIVTLVPIHKPITGYPVWNHYLGHLPSIASLMGHLIYGLVLGIVIIIMIK